MKVLMVCLGNICRSPMAEGIFRTRAQEFNLEVEFDSAGTADYHVGEAPDSRAIAIAKKYGVDISGLRGRQFCTDDFRNFDRIYVMDRSNYKDVLRLAKSQEEKEKVKLLLDDMGESFSEVPDPWYGGEQDFITVFELLDRVCQKIIREGALKKSSS